MIHLMMMMLMIKYVHLMNNKVIINNRLKILKIWVKNRNKDGMMYQQDKEARHKLYNLLFINRIQHNMDSNLNKQPNNNNNHNLTNLNNHNSPTIKTKTNPNNPNNPPINPNKNNPQNRKLTKIQKNIYL
jgi:hypothetical protein